MRQSGELFRSGLQKKQLFRSAARWQEPYHWWAAVLEIRG